MSPSYRYNAKIMKVIDGDTVDAVVDLGFQVHASIRFRLFGVNTPEKSGVEREQGLRVKAWLEEQILGKDVLIDSTKGQEKFGRWLATIFVPGDELSVNAKLINAGMAKEYFGGKR